MCGGLWNCNCFHHLHSENANGKMTRYYAASIAEMSWSEEFYFGDSLILMQDEIESTPGQIELNIAKTQKDGKT